MTMALGRIEENSAMNSHDPRATKPSINWSLSSCTAELRRAMALGVKKGCSAPR